MPNDQVGAYQSQQRQNLTPREAEAMAFTKAAVLLDDASKDPSDYEAFAQALRFNHLLWTIIQADITDKANTLPPMIKANVLSLSIFVDKQTALALTEGKPELLNSLVNINRNMAEGLRTTPPGEGGETPEEAPTDDGTAPPSGGGVHA